MKLIVDMNLSPRWLSLLAVHGIEAAHWSEIGASTAADTEIVDYARANDFIILTHDLDFGAILAASGGRKPSVIQVRAVDVRPEAAGEAVIAAVAQFARELELGALLTVDTLRARVTLLPLSM